jgi:hypothetical protein
MPLLALRAGEVWNASLLSTPSRCRTSFAGGTAVSLREPIERHVFLAGMIFFALFGKITELNAVGAR